MPFGSTRCEADEVDFLDLIKRYPPLKRYRGGIIFKELCCFFLRGKFEVMVT